MPVEINIELKCLCTECGRELISKVEERCGRRRALPLHIGDKWIEIEPCPDCLVNQAKEAHEEGYDEGYADCELEYEPKEHDESDKPRKLELED